MAKLEEIDPAVPVWKLNPYLFVSGGGS